MTDAGMLFGITSATQAATALDLVFEDTEFGQVSVEKRVAVQKAKTIEVTDPKTKRKTIKVVRPEQIVISFTNFQYSSPKMTIKVKSSKLKQFRSSQKNLFKKNQSINRKNKN